MILVSVALGIQALALLFWLRLYRRMDRWIWWVVALGFLIMASHRLSEALNYRLIPQFNTITAILIASFALTAVLKTQHWANRRDRQQAALNKVHDNLVALGTELKNRDSIATKIAEILNDLRHQIDYYESQARKHHLPTFKPDSKNGGTDRTRTG